MAALDTWGSIRSTEGVVILGAPSTIAAAEALTETGEYAIFIASDIALRCLKDDGTVMPWMGDVDLAQGAAPAAPVAGLVRMFADTTPVVKFLNSAGQLSPVHTRGAAFTPGLFTDNLATHAWVAAGRINGTDAAPTKLLAGDRMLRIGAGGRHATAYADDKAVIDFEADADWNSGTDTASRMSFKTVPDNSGTLVERLIIGSSGALLVPNGRDLRSDVLYHSDTAIVTPSSIADQTILSQSIPGGTLANNGDRLRVTLWGDFLTNSGTPTFTPKVKWGATTLAGAGVAETASANTRSVYIQLDIVRLTATTQQVQGLWVHSNKGTNGLMPLATTETWVISGAATETLSAASTLQIVSNFTIADATNRMKSVGWNIAKVNA